MKISEHANYLLNEYGRLQFDYAAYCKPYGESLRNEARNNLETYIAELEGKIDQLTAHSDIERQDDKWIPVSERLPKDCELVWVRATNSPHNLPRRAFYTYRNGKWVNDEVDIDNVYSNLYVTHWMPLPESPNDTQTQTIVYGKEDSEVQDV